MVIYSLILYKKSKQIKRKEKHDRKKKYFNVHDYVHCSMQYFFGFQAVHHLLVNIITIKKN